MSIPRFAIQRPVMMTMISAIIILLGGISLTRLPVDLLPDISQPTINVRVNYAGVGPLEMEELVTRPLEQQLSAVVGPPADELDLVGGQQPDPAELHVGPRPQRGDGRHPHAHRPRARPPARGRRPAGDSEVRPERAADPGPGRRKRRRLARPRAAARAGRTDAVAAARARQRRRRRDRRTAAFAGRFTSSCRGKRPPRSICRSIASSTSCGRKTRTFRSARSTAATARSCCGARGSSRTSSRSSNLVVLTKAGVPDLPEGHRRRHRLDRRHPIGAPDQRPARRPPAGHEAVGHQHRRRLPQDVRAEIERINREVPGVKLTLLEDNAKFIERAISAVSGARDDRLGARHPHHLPVPPQLPVDAHRRHVDPDLGRRHLRAALLRAA